MEKSYEALLAEAREIARALGGEAAARRVATMRPENLEQFVRENTHPEGNK